MGNYAWKPDPKSEDRNRRSIYVLAKRNLRLPLFDAFDLPDMHNSCARRSTTTTAPQALLLLNSEFTLDCGAALGRAVAGGGKAIRRSRHADDRPLIAAAYRRSVRSARRAIAELEVCAKFIVRSSGGDLPSEPALEQDATADSVCRAIAGGTRRRSSISATRC